jgi:hypothetical protein
MNMTEHPADIPSSIMGHSIGRFEDGYLIIDTVAFSDGVLTGSIQHTDQLNLQERLSIKNENGQLLIEWTATDPAFYTMPIKGSQQLQSTSQDIIRYDCIPGEPTDYQ